MFSCFITMAFKMRSGTASWASCFWRVGVKTPFLDGSSVLTNICTDMEVYSHQQTVNASFVPLSATSLKMMPSEWFPAVCCVEYELLYVLDDMDWSSLLTTHAHSCPLSSKFIIITPNKQPFPFFASQMLHLGNSVLSLKLEVLHLNVLLTDFS